MDWYRCLNSLEYRYLVPVPVSVLVKLTGNCHSTTAFVLGCATCWHALWSALWYAPVPEAFHCALWQGQYRYWLLLVPVPQTVRTRHTAECLATWHRLPERTASYCIATRHGASATSTGAAAVAAARAAVGIVGSWQRAADCGVTSAPVGVAGTDARPSCGWHPLLSTVQHGGARQWQRCSSPQRRQRAAITN